MGNTFNKHQQELEQLEDVSKRFLLSRKNLAAHFKISGKTIFMNLTGHIGMLIIYNISKNTSKIIETRNNELEELYFCYTSPCNENEFFLYEFEDCLNYYSVVDAKENELEINLFEKQIQLTRSLTSSVSFHKLKFIKSFNIGSVLELKRNRNNLLVSCKKELIMIDLVNNEIISKRNQPWGEVKPPKFLKQIRYNIFITNRFTCIPGVGYVETDSLQKSDSVKISRNQEYFMGISKNEEYIFTYDEGKSLGRIYQMSSRRNDQSNCESDVSFYLVKRLLDFDFSEDSQFLWVLEEGEAYLENSLIAFSIQEKKFVFHMKLKAEKFFIQNNFVICRIGGGMSFLFAKIEILEIQLPIQLKPSLLKFEIPDLFFKFQ
jgi:hypothetical protein